MADLYSGVDVTKLAQTVRDLNRGECVRSVKTAGGNLAGGQVARIDGDVVTLASNDDYYSALSALGVVEFACPQGGNASIITFGELQDPGFNFSPQAALYLGTNGQLVEGRQALWPYARAVATAVTATRIFVAPVPPIYQAR